MGDSLDAGQWSMDKFWMPQCGATHNSSKLADVKFFHLLVRLESELQAHEMRMEIRAAGRLREACPARWLWGENVLCAGYTEAT